MPWQDLSGDRLSVSGGLPNAGVEPAPLAWQQRAPGQQLGEQPAARSLSGQMQATGLGALTETTRPAQQAQSLQRKTRP